MQTWLRLIGTALLGSSLVFACTIGDPSDDDDFDENFDDTDDGGSAGSAGSAAAGKGGSAGSSAGSGGSAGSAGTGGTAAGTGGTAGSAGSSGSGGEDGIPDDLECQGVGTDLASSCEFEAFTPGYQACQECLSTSCCEEIRGCYATDPSDACGWGGVDGVPEYMCYIGCLVEAAEAGGGVYDENVDLDRCAFECGTPRDGLGNACPTQLISDRTNELVSCMHAICENECIFDVVDAD